MCLDMMNKLWTCKSGLVTFLRKRYPTGVTNVSKLPFRFFLFQNANNCSFLQVLCVDIERETRSFIKFDKDGKRPMYEEQFVIQESGNLVSDEAEKPESQCSKVELRKW